VTQANAEMWTTYRPAAVAQQPRSSACTGFAVTSSVERLFGRTTMDPTRQIRQSQSSSQDAPTANAVSIPSVMGAISVSREIRSPPAPRPTARTQWSLPRGLQATASAKRRQERPNEAKSCQSSQLPARTQMHPSVHGLEAHMATQCRSFGPHPGYWGCPPVTTRDNFVVGRKWPTIWGRASAR
jgi:hypothetical protein